MTYRLIALMLALLAIAAAPGWAQQPAKTAQSAMLTIDSPALPAHFVVIGSYTYSYDRKCAETYFSCKKVEKTWIGTETAVNSNCFGDPTSWTSEDAQGKLSQVINDNDCNFFDGQALNASAGNSTGSCKDFSNSSPANTKESSERTDYECTVLGAPGPGYVNPGDIPTCWTLTSEVGELPTITPGGIVASESAMCNKQHPLKYSFTLQDPLSLNGVRVAGLTATLAGPVEFTWSEAIGNLSVAPYLIGSDFEYRGSNGANGNVGLLTSSGPGYNPGCTSEPAMVNAIQGGSVKACATLQGCAEFDAFAGNNGTGGDRAAYTGLVPSPELAPGSYKLEVTGTIKGSVSGLAELPFSVCASVTVDAGQCLQVSSPAPCP